MGGIAMMDILFEQNVIQNSGLAAETIWQAVSEGYEGRGRAEGISLPLVFIVLPLTFHQRSASVLASKAQPGALYKALGEDREILIGLQQRMQAMSDRTFAALSIAFDSALLKLDVGSDRQLIPGRRTSPVDHVTVEVKTIMAAAKRVGQAFSEMSPTQLSAQLNIRF